MLTLNEATKLTELFEDYAEWDKSNKESDIARLMKCSKEDIGITKAKVEDEVEIEDECGFEDAKGKKLIAYMNSLM